jgi:hypothetical protein
MMSFTQRLDIWKNVLLAPSTTLAGEAKKAEMGMKDGTENFGTAIILTYLPLLLLGLILTGTFSVFSIVGILIGLAFAVLGVLITSILFSAICYVVGMILGGKTSFGHLYYMVSSTYAPIQSVVFVISIIAMVLAQVSVIAGIVKPISSIASLILVLYSLYLLTIAFEKTYGFGKLKAVAVWLVPVVVLGVVAFVIFGALLLSMLSLFMR